MWDHDPELNHTVVGTKKRTVTGLEESSALRATRVGISIQLGFHRERKSGGMVTGVSIAVSLGSPSPVNSCTKIR